jgi:hypothetical protein
MDFAGFFNDGYVAAHRREGGYHSSVLKYNEKTPRDNRREKIKVHAMLRAASFTFLIPKQTIFVFYNRKTKEDNPNN